MAESEPTKPERLAELRQKFGRQPQPETVVEKSQPTPREKQPRFRGLESGHRACQGCGEALGARYVVDAAMRAADNNLVAVNATGCLEVFSTPYPESSWQVPWMHSLFGNAPAVATGVAAALRAKGDTQTRVLAQGGDGGTVDIGFGCLSGMFDRNDDVLYICYDNEAYMNTGVQRSARTPPAARTATTPATGRHPGNAMNQGKNPALIAMAHEIPYVATASVADLHDLEAKVTRAMGMGGARYVHIHVPCPLGWGSRPCDTIKLARLAVESGLFPLYEVFDGMSYRINVEPDGTDLAEYFDRQRRFRDEEIDLDVTRQVCAERLARLHTLAAQYPPEN